MVLIDQEAGTSDIILEDKFILKGIIGQGAFGSVYQATTKESSVTVAVKIEKNSAVGHAILYREAKILSALGGRPGFPKLYAFGQYKDSNYMVINILGLNLEEYMKIIDGPFSLKTVLMLADQMLARIEILHELNYIHRDIKPANFMMGIGANRKKLFIIDFGLARRYKGASGEHISYKLNRGMIGTARFASVNSHSGVEQSRRDDLEAIGYTLIYLFKGLLPWQNIQAATKEEKYKRIGEMKIALSIETLCEGLPKEFAIYLNYVRNLKFDEPPNYKYLKKLFRKLFLETGYDLDSKYDWDYSKEEIVRGLSSKALVSKNTIVAKQKKPQVSFPNLQSNPQKNEKHIEKEEQKRANVANDDASTEKMSKGVCIERHRIKRRDNPSFEVNTSNVMHISALSGTKRNKGDDDNESPDIQLAVNEVTSNRAEDFAFPYSKFSTLSSEGSGFLRSKSQKRNSRSIYHKQTSESVLARDRPKGLFGRFITMKNWMKAGSYGLRKGILCFCHYN